MLPLLSAFQTDSLYPLWQRITHCLMIIQGLLVITSFRNCHFSESSIEFMPAQRSLTYAVVFSHK